MAGSSGPWPHAGRAGNGFYSWLRSPLAWAIFIFFLGSVSSQESEVGEIRPRNKKQFALFTVVTFQNQQCVVLSDNAMRGQCLSSTECEARGGSSDGKCASGFGVCCMFVVSTCGSTVTRNCTYIQNPGYDGAFTETSETCNYRLDSEDPGICQLRLDFDDVQLAQPDAVGSCAAATGDALTVTSPTGRSPPVICGMLSGQHMYVETGLEMTAGMLDIRVGSATMTRKWKIKVSQIECSNPVKAPEDCVQYFTESSGTIESYNFPRAIRDQQYSMCFRQNLGNCAQEFRAATQTTPDPFQLGGSATSQRSSCNVRFLRIRTNVYTIIANQNTDNYCGATLAAEQGEPNTSPVRSNVNPQVVDVIFEDADTADTITGFKLVYNAVPCM